MMIDSYGAILSQSECPGRGNLVAKRRVIGGWGKANNLETNGSGNELRGIAKGNSSGLILDYDIGKVRSG
jgi:hypothetical protein